MKKKNISFLLATVFATTAFTATPTSLAVAESATRTPEPVYAISYDVIGGSDVMPIGGWWGPYEQNFGSTNANQIPNYNQDKFYKLLRDCGVNTITVTPNALTGRNGLERIMRALDLCKENRMAYYVYDATITTCNSSKTMLNQISAYINHDACVGIHVFDEPQVTKFDSIALTYKNYAELGITNKYLYTNLLPIYAGNYSGSSQSVTYEEYVTEFIEKVKPPFISTDNYPFYEKDTGTGSMTMLFRELSTLRSVAQKYGIPFWGFVQAGGQWHDDGGEHPTEPYFPSEGEMIWNINTLLAYGCKSIQYFTLIMPEKYSYELNDQRDFNRIGLLGAAGNKNEWYFYAQKANKQIAAIDHVLMNACNMGVIPVGLSPEGMVIGDERLESFRELTSCVAENAIVGCFDYFGKTALYVVNNSSTDKQAVKLNFDKKYNYEVIQRANSKIVAAKTLPLTLEAGEGVMVVLQ